MKLVRPALHLTLLALSTLPLSVEARAECDRPVDPKRAVIFLGLNEAFIERKAAEEAACLRGEAFYSLPKPLDGEEIAVDAFLTINRLTLTLESIEAELTRKNCDDEEKPSTQCRTLQVRQNELLSARTSADLIYMDYWSRLFNVVRTRDIDDTYAELLRELAANDISPTSIILSGHSGGRGVWGYLGTLDFSSVQTAIRTAYIGKETLLSNLEQVLLWGCNTMNPFDGGNIWVKFLPTVKMIFGFQGSAPSSKNPASSTLLKSTLQSVPSLDDALKLKNPEKTIKSVFDSLRGIEHTIGSTYINDTAGQRAFYYERISPDHLDDQGKLTTTWTSSVKPVMTEAECEHMKPALEADQQLGRQVFEGKIEIPFDTSSGILRDLYTRARRNEVCRKSLGLELDADQFGYLLFWHNIKKNAARLVGTSARPFIKDIKGYLGGDSRIENARNAAIKSGKNEKTKVISDYQRAIAETEKSIATLAATFQSYQDVSESMPWSKKHERALRRLTKKIKKLSPENSEGAALKIKFHVLAQLRAISGPNFSQSLKKILDGLTTQKENAVLSIKLYEESIKKTQSQIIQVGSTDSYKSALQGVLDAMPPLSASEATPLTYTELAKKIEHAKTKITSARSYIGNISELSDLRTSLEKIDNNIQFYGELAVKLRRGCLDFQSWHDFSENALGQEIPRSLCDPTLQLLFNFLNPIITTQ